MHVAQELIALGALLLGLGLLATVASRFGVSPIPLYLLAGLAFGTGGVAPLPISEDFIEIGAEIGVILLLLTLGLEYTARELLTNMRRSAPIGVLDIALNAAPGVAVAFLLGWGPVAAVALGGITCVSSSGVVAKVIDDLGWQGNRETPTVLSVLVIEDLVMALYLPVLTGLLNGAGVINGGVTVVLAVVSVGIVLLIAARYGRAVEWLIASPNNEVLLLKILGLGLLVAGLASKLHVSAAVGAFLVGIALSGPVATLAHQRLEPLRDLFAAVFFVFFGLQTDPTTLPPVALAAGAALIPRGEFSVVIAGLAVAGGLSHELGPLATAYVLILAIVGPLAARLVDVAARRRRRRTRGPHGVREPGLLRP